MKTDETRRWLRNYFAETASLLPCGRREKHALLRELRQNVEDYLADAPEAPPETLLSVFGTPEQIAESMLQTVKPASLRKKLTLKKAVLLALLAAVLIYAAFVVVSLIDVHTEAHGYFTEGILRIITGTGETMI